MTEAQASVDGAILAFRSGPNSKTAICTFLGMLAGRDLSPTALAYAAHKSARVAAVGHTGFLNEELDKLAARRAR